MNRPQSAKPGHKGYWGQSSADDINDQNINNSQKNHNRKQIKILKPDLTTHDFARILPRKIHQDKQRLYSQALQLKQNLNEVVEQNIRLKTKISILQKQKVQMNRYIETVPQGLGGKGNSRINIYHNKSNEKDSMIIRNLKKIVRQLREEKENLQLQSQKIKKMMKYTKINQLQIQRKIISDQNKRLNNIIQQISSRYMDQEDLQNQNEELKKYLQEEIDQKNQMKQEHNKYEEIIESLQEKIKAQNEKYVNKEKKILRDLNGQKRKCMALQRKNDQLFRELQNLRQNQVFIQQNKKKLLAKPISRNHKLHTNPSNPSRETQNNNIDNPINKELQAKYQTVKTQNQELENQLKDLKEKLKKAQESILFAEQKSKNELKENSMLKDKNESKLSYDSKLGNRSKRSVGSGEGSYDVNNEQDYNQQFQTEEINSQREINNKQKQDQEKLLKLKKDFQQNQEEEELFTQKSKKKQKNNKEEHNQEKDKKKKKKKTQNKDQAFKPNKKILAEIKQLLTYRMKSQRYPFEDLKNDIQAAEASIFSYADLCSMLVNEPFYLTSEYTKIFLQFCYSKQKIANEQTIDKALLISKLRKCIDDFQLMEQNQQHEMIVRIAQMTITYPRQLQIAFENIKNGEQTVSKNNLIQMFQKLELQDKYIQLIISELSLCSNDLQHLNFHGFFQRFYIEDDNDFVENNPIEQQGQQSQQSYKHSSRAKKQNGKKTNKASNKHSDNEQPKYYQQNFDQQKQDNEKA